MNNERKLEDYIFLHRKLIESRVFKNAELLKLWIYFLLRANHAEAWVPVKTGKGITEVKVKPGQFIFGRFVTAKATGQKPSTVRNNLLKLKKMGNVDTQVDTHYTIITICKWGDYQYTPNEVGQVSGQPKDNQRTGKGQPKDTNNKNIKKEQPIYVSDFSKKTADHYSKIVKKKYEHTQIKIEDQPLHIQKLLDKGYSERQIRQVLRFIVDSYDNGIFNWLHEMQSLAKLPEPPKKTSKFHGVYKCYMDVFLDKIADATRRDEDDD